MDYIAGFYQLIRHHVGYYHYDHRHYDSYVMKALQDCNGKPSAKRIAGWICLVIGLMMAVAGGFDFYGPDNTVVITVFSAGTTLLGLGVIEKKAPAVDN